MKTFKRSSFFFSSSLWAFKKAVATQGQGPGGEPVPGGEGDVQAGRGQAARRQEEEERRAEIIMDNFGEIVVFLLALYSSYL